MKKVFHESAKPSHYNKEAEHYDAFNENGSQITNQTIGRIFKQNRVRTVLDLTCGTGSQVFWLDKHGYEVVGSDINQKMLNIARSKSKKEGLNIKFIKGDMRTTKAGRFDAVITIFNAIGHLTKRDFEKSIKNIHENLNEGGLYVFDIFNLNYLLDGDNITKLTIDGQREQDSVLRREIQYSTIDQKGILASYDTYFEQKGDRKPKVSYAHQTLQVYSADQLKDMLERHGFKLQKKSCMDGTRFSDKKSERLLVVAKKLSA